MEDETHGLCIEKIYMTFIYIFFNKNLSKAYIKKSEGTIQHLKTRHDLVL
jgi:hypothetical protein